MATEFDGGVVIGADSRTTSGYVHHWCITWMCGSNNESFSSLITERTLPIALLTSWPRLPIPSIAVDQDLRLILKLSPTLCLTTCHFTSKFFRTVHEWIPNTASFLFRMENNEAPLVKTAANVFREMCYNYRDQMSAGIICAGWDKRHGGQVSLR